MAGDPYADFATPVTAPPAKSAGADPYADLAQPVIAHDITAKNGKVYRVLLNSEDQRAQLEQAINEHIDAGDPDLKGAPLPFNASVRHSAPPPPPPPPPDTSFGHDIAVGLNGAVQGLYDIGDSFNALPAAANLPLTAASLVAKYGRSALDASGFGKPETPGQHFIQAGTRGIAAAGPFAVEAAPLRAGAVLASGASSGLSGEAARQGGYGRGVQTAASVAGGLAAGGGITAFDRPSTANLPALAEGVVPPMPRGPMAAISRLTGADRSVGARLVAQRLHDDGINPYDAGRTITEAQSSGTPLALADLGENTRALAGSVTRQPGPARTIGKQFTQERQMGQMDRVRDAINRDIGPTTDVLEESNQLQQRAQTAAAPLYDKAYAAPPLQSPRLAALLATPAGKAALKRATTIAANEGHDPATMGVRMDSAGEPMAPGSLSTQTLDYVKRALDDSIEEGRSDVTGKLKLNEVQRSVNTVKNRLLDEMDRLNPDYASARQAYAGPAAMRSAMLDGKAALNKSASEINQRIKNMTSPEAEQYGLGLRSAMADAMAGSPDGANKVRALIGNPKRREVLQLVFGGRANLDHFVSTMENEHAAFETYQAVHGGPATAGRIGEDQANSDSNLLRGLGSDLAAVGNGPVGIGFRMLERGGDVLRFGAGKTGQRAREDAASLLFSTSPTEFEDALGKLTLKSRRDLYRRQGLFPVTGAAAAASHYGNDQP